MPLPTSSDVPSTSSHSVPLRLQLPLALKPPLSAAFSHSLACTCTAQLPPSTASSRRSSAVDSESESFVSSSLQLLCGCRSFTSHVWIARKCRDCGHDRSVHRMAGEAAKEAEKAAEEANYAHAGTIVINSARGLSRQQPEARQVPSSVSGDGSVNSHSHIAVLSAQSVMLKQPSSPAVGTTPLSGLSPRLPPPLPAVARSPPAPPSRRPPTSPRPPAASTTQARSTPVTPLTSPTQTSMPPPLPSPTAATNTFQLAAPHQLAAATYSIHATSACSSSRASEGSGTDSPPSPSSSGPSPALSDYTVQCSLRASAEDELRECRSALSELEAAASGPESTSAVHIRSLLTSLAAAQTQLEAAQRRAKQNEDDISALRDQVRQERWARERAEAAVQQADRRYSEQRHGSQQWLREIQQCPVGAQAQHQSQPAAMAEEKEAEVAGLTGPRDTHQPPPPLPRRPAQISGSSVAPSAPPSPFFSVAASLTLTPRPASHSVPLTSPSKVADGRRQSDIVSDAHLTLSTLRPPLTVESVLHHFHACLGLSDAYLQYLSRFVDEALEQHSSHSAQLAAVADIAGEVEQNAYELLRRIGAGGFGEVYEGRRKRDGERVAVKVIDLELSSEDVATISQEVLSLSSTRLCAQLVNYYGCCVVHTSSLWLAMELVADGSLLHHLQQHGPFSEEAIAIVCREVLLGLQYMLSEDKVHRDVKSANILVNVQRGLVKLTDFGASRQLSDTLKKCNTLIGSPYWMAPEVLLRSDYDGQADIWSLGITLIELATGRPPHAHIPPMQVMQKIVDWPAPTLHDYPGRAFSAAFASFIDQCLHKDPCQRATVSQLLRHEFVKRARSTSKLKGIFAERSVGGKQR